MWKNFRYCVKIECFYHKTNQIAFKYVTSINNDTREFTYHTLEEIEEQKLSIVKLTIKNAEDFMNRLYCNGFKASIEPYFGGN